MSDNLESILHKHYGFSTFRPGQKEAIEAILAGRDVLAVLPTGGGKSLIYQLPALMFDGLTLIISPLIALMKDQVDAMVRRGLPATFINSALSEKDTTERLQEIRNGKYKIVYIAPERFYNQEFMKSLKEIKVSFLAVDEAHCISQWGHDFRPSYLRLKKVVEELGRPVVAALTATATPEVKTDIVKQLEMKDPKIVVTGFARPNLNFGVISASSGTKIELIVEAAERFLGQSGIVYAGTRSKADDLAAALNDSGLEALVYHAGMDQGSRDWVQESFISGDAKVIVATNAFGLGVDKKDVRFVIHHDLPPNIEAYYQEAGRAGRDGGQSLCLLLHSPQDRHLREYFIKGDNPSPHMISEIYDFLIDKREETVLTTYAEITKHLSEQAPEMAVGTGLKILEREGYISRPNDKNSGAFLKFIASEDELRGAVSPRAKGQKEIMEGLLTRFSEKLYAGLQINFEELAKLLGVKKDAILRLAKKLAEANLAEYQPPFRGTEIKILKRVPVTDLNLDYRALKEKLQRAYGKLDEMENYVYNNRCRQQFILSYFGEQNAAPCGTCDICSRQAYSSTKAKKVPPKSFLSDV